MNFIILEIFNIKYFFGAKIKRPLKVLLLKPQKKYLLLIIRLEDMFFFDTSSKTWQKIQINGYKPGGRACHSLTCVDRFLYMFGGFNGVRSFNKLEVFDIENGTWTALNDVRGNVPVSRDAHAMVVYKDSLYLYGGHDGENYLNDMYEFSIPNKTWTQILASNSIVNGIRGHSANCIGQNIYIFGGYDGKLRSNVILVYNIETRSWSSPLVDIESSAINFMSGRQRHSSNFFKNGEVIIFGGFDGKSMLNDVHFISVSLLEENIIKREALLQHQANIRQLLFKEKLFADVEILVEEKSILVHKNLLVCQSKKFEAMFRSRQRLGKPQNTMVLSTNNGSVFEKKNFAAENIEPNSHFQRNSGQVSDLYNYGVSDQVEMETNTGGNLCIKSSPGNRESQSNDSNDQLEQILTQPSNGGQSQTFLDTNNAEDRNQNSAGNENKETLITDEVKEKIAKNWGIQSALKFEYAGPSNVKKSKPEIQPESGKNKHSNEFDNLEKYDEEPSHSFLFDLNDTKSNCEFNFKEKDENMLIYPVSQSSRVVIPNDSMYFTKNHQNLLIDGICYFSFTQANIMFNLKSDFLPNNNFDFQKKYFPVFYYSTRKFFE